MYGRRTIMAFIKRRFATATTMVEVALAIVIVAIVIVGCSILFAATRGQIRRQKTFRAATQLAAQKLEILKAKPYSDSALNEGDYSDSNSIDGVSCTRYTHIEDSNSYKTVRVSVCWGASNEPNVTLVTIIAP